MPRSSRNNQYQPNAVCAITVRGNGREKIFRDDADYREFLEIIKARKTKYHFKLYAYCLLEEYYQLIIEAGEANNISKIMQAINTSYAIYFNKKYYRAGHLMSNRFESRVVNKDSSLISAVEQLHSSPLRMKLGATLSDYNWSSYLQYSGNNQAGIADVELVKSLGYVPETEPVVEEEAKQEVKQGHFSRILDVTLRRKVSLTFAALFLVFLSIGLWHKFLPSVRTPQFSVYYLRLPDNLPQAQGLIPEAEVSEVFNVPVH